jgi:hypothetical protein
MKVEIEYGTTYIVDTETGVCIIKSNGVRISSGRRIAKLRQLAAQATE